ncbi:MAG: hypothetical protein MK108_05005 [Mariniblastus sp.]|nr:hypothetical protein [Mariniblastus sp.]
MLNSFLNSARLRGCALGLVLVLLPGLATAQSRVISADPSDTGAGGPGSRTIQFGASRVDSEAPTLSSISPNDRSLEQILNLPFDEEYYEVPFIEVMNKLQDDYQLNMILDQTAEDDSLTADDPITFKATGIRLKNALRLMLKEKNATFIIGNETLQIISLDVANDPDYFVSEFYPIESLSYGNYADLVADIQASVNPEGWYDTNGDAHISYLSVNGRPSLSLYAPYATHQQLQEYLANIRRISPAAVGRQLVTSQVIQLPSSQPKREPKKKKKGYGIGGFGGGGGVF